MSDLTDLRQPDPTSPDEGDLRATLELMRQQAEEEIGRLNRKLAQREVAAESSIASATERIALQQELTTLQHALGIKEQTLDKITDECRRLEDQLEDQHVAFDGLKQEVERKEGSLRAARNEVERLQRQLAEVREHSVDASQPASPIGPPLPPVEPDRGPPIHHRVFGFAAGLIAGLAVLGIVGLVAWRGYELGWFGQGVPARPRNQAQTPPPQPAPTVAVSESAKAAPAAAPVAPVASPALAPGQTLPTLRDPLRDGSQGPTLVQVPGRIFRMGHNSLAGGDAGPEHDVALAPFLIGAYEVTFEQYDRFVRATGRRFPDDYGWGRGTRPVVGVSWSEADAYADWLSRQTGRRYRLPSEAEWEMAARAGTPGSFWWGFGMEADRAACFDCGSQWDNRSTAPVGSFSANPFGLYDTAGNALEWVADCYSPGYQGAPADGRPRALGNCTHRVGRGGAFNRPSSSLRVWTRTKLVPDTRIGSLGFRVAREP